MARSDTFVTRRLEWDSDESDQMNAMVVALTPLPTTVELIAAARDFYTTMGEALIDGAVTDVEDNQRAGERLRLALKPFDNVEV